jgi:HD-GYP domain-containing protein (c-di-GMP phosphodiesterase class II)
MKQTLFSMADSIAEAIEGRTPYNANHTKNVAKRSVEMLRYINKKHKEGKCAYHFSANDIDQMYLAAMLHDIGKMDVPLEIMDKPTKLGNKEERLKMRLEIIRLHIENDLLSGKIKNSEAEKKLKLIDAFLEKLELYNCGKPLTDEEKKAIEKFSRMTYVCSEDDVLSYLTDEEFEDLSIRAGTLSDSERTVMQSHVVYTNKILSHVHFGESFDKVTAMASNHHELMNGKGYPNGIGAEQLDIMTRILTIMDIYDSLIADDRPYKKPKSPEEAFRILDEEAEAGKLDKELVEIAKEMYLKEEG